MRPTPYSNELYHHGVKGQRWGVRRYRNEDGSLTPAGKKHEAKLERYRQKEINALERGYARTSRTDARILRRANKKLDAQADSGDKHDKAERNYLRAVTRQSFNKGLYLAEQTRLRDMTVDELDKERSAVRKYKAVTYGSMIAAPIMASIGGIGVYKVPHVREFKADRRLTADGIRAADRYAIRKRAIAASGAYRATSNNPTQYKAKVRKLRELEYPTAQELRDSLNISPEEWVKWGG